MDQQVTVKANHESVQPFPALHKIDFNQLRDVWNNNSSSNEADFVLKSKSKWNLFSLDSPLNPINWMSSPLFALALLNPSSAEDTARWGLVSTQPAYGPSHTIEYDQPSEPRPDYARLPLDFRFTALGTHHFTFSELMHANDNPVLKKYLSIKIGDFGGVTITAKQDLGTLKITNRYSIKTKQEFMKYYYEEQLHRNQVTHSFTLCDDAQAVPLFHTQYNLEITQPKNKGSQVHQLEVQKSQLRTSDERMRIIP